MSEDILYLPFVESAFNPKAYSSAGAAGLWQIMPRTGRTLGLQLNATIDERFDPESATWAAARYLRNSTDSLTKLAKEIDPNISDSAINPFVITSYNYGVSGMRRAIRQFGPDYITVLNKYKSASFRTAVRNFYSSFLAARYVAQNFEKYFGDFRADDGDKRSVVVLKRPT
ncbi:MAG: lytic transglycosylase domain-containing protein, partial [bacterium]|nr:lytic transglycosylase domain-containing protein [bacterium]